MSSIARCALILVLSFGCAGFVSAVHAQTKPAPKLPLSSVSGRVTIHEKGAPGIVVGIRNLNFSMQPAPAPKATTDQDGNYRITDLPPGNYQVSPIAPAYVTIELAVSHGRGKTLLLASGEDIQGIDFSLARGGVITGKVKDSNGRPVIEERVNLVTEDKANPQGSMFSSVGSGSFQTDDRGVYRIYGIPVGRYKISVGVGEDEPSTTRPGRTVYVRTFYPDAVEPDKAETLQISEGTEHVNIDITVSRGLPSYVASGKVVIGDSGEPAGGLRVGLRRVIRNREGGGMGNFTTSNSRGEFRLENVRPGKYMALVSPQPGSDVRTDPVPLEVIDQDVTGLLLKTVNGLSISGTVVLEGNYDKNVAAKLAELRLQAYVHSEAAYSGSWQDAAINSDGSFRLGGLGPGTVNFAITTKERRSSVAFNILRIERDGVELSPRSVEIKAGEEITGVRVVVSYGSGSIRGEVKLENGELRSDERILVWITGPGAARSNPRPANLDARGHFLIEGLAAGSYEINARVDTPGRPRGPETKQTIDVADGPVTAVVLTIDRKSDPE
ncbi:MAG TPA: hypothetical protein VGN90_00885 [Pyrinomonadaceae bacterium]|nr:hypothetical protein [Pyrinomonadaceae bacterium]